MAFRRAGWRANHQVRIVQSAALASRKARLPCRRGSRARALALRLEMSAAQAQVGKDLERGRLEVAMAAATEHPRKRLTPEIEAAWREFGRAVFKAGALDAKTKQLIAVAVAHVTQCPYCIPPHPRSAAGRDNAAGADGGDLGGGRDARRRRGGAFPAGLRGLGGRRRALSPGAASAALALPAGPLPAAVNRLSAKISRRAYNL